VTDQITRRVRLPAEQTAPGAARSVVRSVVTEAGLDAVLDEALLLTTELATNAVIHAGTGLELVATVEAGRLTVTVLDEAPGPLHAGPPGGHADERGRGLLLVDRMAARWGTVHHSGGKGVWFQLDAASAGAPPDPATAAAAPTPAVDPLLASFELRGDLPETVEELLRRVGTAAGAASGALLVDEGDSAGPRLLAGFGAPTPHLDGALRVPLRLSRPWRGELVLSGAPDGPLVRLTAERIGLLVENDRLRRTDLERRSWLTFLAEASDLLAQSLDVDLTLALIPRLVVPRLGPWCAVHVLDDDGSLRLAACTHTDESTVPKLLDELDAARPQLLEAIGLDSAMPLAAPVDGVSVALIARGQRLGTLSVGRDPGRWQRPEELAVVEDIARRAALAIDNARIHAERRSVAQALQRSLLPPELPVVTGVDLGAEYVPTGETVDVGGDFYDLVRLPDDDWVIVVGDVSGKGVQAAIVTGLVRDVTRVLVRDGRPPVEALTRLNETLVERGGGRFCTLALATLHRRADRTLDVTLHLAGHDQPVLVDADGNTALVGRCGTALGLLPVVKSPSALVTLHPGDMLIFFTDGVTERRHRGQLFGIDRLRREAGALAGFPAEVVAGRLRTAAVTFSPDPPRDDIAIFVLRNDQ